MAHPEPGGCAGAEPYALRVLGDSMEPEFADGCVVIVDPSGRAGDGSFVIAEHEGEYLLRQLRARGEQWSLAPLNPGYPTFDLASLAAVRGVVVQRAGTRRRYHKRYD